MRNATVIVLGQTLLSDCCHVALSRELPVRRLGCLRLMEVARRPNILDNRAVEYDTIRYGTMRYDMISVFALCKTVPYHNYKYYNT